jgi:uncharacterized membrane protein
MKTCFKYLDKCLFGAGWGLLSFGFVARQLGYAQNALDFAMGIGCGFILVGAISMAVKLRNPKYAKQADVEQRDERNVMLNGKAGYVTFFTTLFALVAMAIVFLAINNETACYITLALLAIHMLTFLIALTYFKKKM